MMHRPIIAEVDHARLEVSQAYDARVAAARRTRDAAYAAASTYAARDAAIDAYDAEVASARNAAHAALRALD